MKYVEKLGMWVRGSENGGINFIYTHTQVDKICKNTMLQY